MPGSRATRSSARRCPSRWGNYVGVNESAKEIFGKLMSITDDLMWRYYELLSSLPATEIAAMRVKVSMGEVHPKAAKQQLALEIAGRFAGEAEAAAALAEFERVFARGALPDTIEEKTLAGPTTLLKALVDTSLVSSNGEGRRLIAQGGVTLDGNRQENANAALAAGEASREAREEKVLLFGGRGLNGAPARRPKLLLSLGGQIDLA
jgi:tyrosyl-tRNA synthetase